MILYLCQFTGTCRIMNLEDSIGNFVGRALWDTVWQCNSISILDYTTGDVFHSVYRSVYTPMSPSVYFTIHKHIRTYDT